MTPRATVFVAVLAIRYSLLQRQAGSQASKICQVSCRFGENDKRIGTWEGAFFVLFLDKDFIFILLLS